jgi:hypothetical protein
MPGTEEFITKTRKYEISKRDVKQVRTHWGLRPVPPLVFRVFVLSGFRDCPITVLKCQKTVSPPAAQVGSERSIRGHHRSGRQQEFEWEFLGHLAFAGERDGGEG